MKNILSLERRKVEAVESGYLEIRTLQQCFTQSECQHDSNYYWIIIPILVSSWNMDLEIKLAEKPQEHIVFYSNKSV